MKPTRPRPPRLPDPPEHVVRGDDLANANRRGGRVHDRVLEDLRLTGATFDDGSLRDVRLERCRADLASAVHATIERVAFVDCDLREVAFDGAHLRDVLFVRCDLAGASFSQARVERVELAGCDLARVRSVADLRGAWMPVDDVVANAVVLASAAGIRVIADDD